LGFNNVDLAENGQEALELIQNTYYDIVLMDCQMPEMDGYKATSLVREHEKEISQKRHLPVIALTANAMVGDREKCLRAGMDDYLSKPIKPDKLLDIIKKWAGTPKQATEDTKNEIEDNSDLKVMDWERLLLFSDGNRDDENALIEMFVQHAQESMNVLKKYEIIDHEQWKSMAHKLKGSSANLGAEKLSEACLKAEKLAEDSKQEKKALLENIEKCYSALLQCFENRE
jgi:CheY-like chemotaxis protein/HPt (histidine-containing phosphotransfer) domain-containing protein